MSFNKITLENGIDFVSYEMKEVKTVAINIIANVGSRYETDSEEGISHFLEHMAFKGTKTRSYKQIAEEFDVIGGQFNAYTSKEQTVYYARVLEEHTDKAIDILSDILLNSEYKQEEIEKEKKVIGQEIAQTQDNPDDLGYENLMAQAFSKQPLGKSILGTTSSIAKFSTEDFQNYVGKHYHSGNIIISAAGLLNSEKLSRQLSDRFNGLRSGSKSSPVKARYQQGNINTIKELEQTTIYLAYESFNYQDPTKFYLVQILALILGGGISSRLFQKIREEEGLCYSVGSFNSAFSDTGLFSLYAGCADDKASEVISRMKEELEKIKEAITEEELTRAKSQIKASILMASEKPSYKAEELGKAYSLYGRHISTEEVLAEVELISTDDLRGIANQIFSSSPSCSIVSKKEIL